MDNLMTALADILQFVMAGNAYFTVVSPSGKRFTFKVWEPKKLRGSNPDGTTRNPYGIRYVAVLTGCNNTSDYTYIGSVSEKGSYKYKSEQIGPEAESVTAFTWVIGKILKQHSLGPVQFWHEGRCGRCGKKLTVDTSIKQGFGPECAGLV